MFFSSLLFSTLLCNVTVTLLITLLSCFNFSRCFLCLSAFFSAARSFPQVLYSLKFGRITLYSLSSNIAHPTLAIASPKPGIPTMSSISDRSAFLNIPSVVCSLAAPHTVSSDATVTLRITLRVTISLMRPLNPVDRILPTFESSSIMRAIPFTFGLVKRDGLIFIQSPAIANHSSK